MRLFPKTNKQEQQQQIYIYISPPSVPISKNTDLTSMTFELQKLIISRSSLQLTMIAWDTFFSCKFLRVCGKYTVYTRGILGYETNRQLLARIRFYCIFSGITS